MIRSGQNVINAFVRGANNQVYETWYSFQTGQWGGWISMGGTITSDPQTIATSDGHEQVFGTANNLVQENWFEIVHGYIGCLEDVLNNFVFALLLSGTGFASEFQTK